VNAHHQIWQVWAARLHHWGLGELAATLLEITSPVNTVGAQLVYIGQPLLRGMLPGEQLDALATLLENQNDTSAFVNFLRETSP